MAIRGLIQAALASRASRAVVAEANCEAEGFWGSVVFTANVNKCLFQVTTRSLCGCACMCIHLYIWCMYIYIYRERVCNGMQARVFRVE